MRQSDIDLIKKHEGFEPMVYKCTEGFDTIGYGFAIKNLDLTREEAELILKRRLSALELKIYQKFDWYADSDETIKCVVLNMCYQLGLTGFSMFKKTIRLLANGDKAKASQEMLQSLWAKQTPNRANELSNLLKYGDIVL
jgi:lysozyme